MLDKKTQKQILGLKERYSIYAPLSDRKLFKLIIDRLAEPFRNSGINKVLGIEARGFILGAPVAYCLNAGFVVARKKGKMYVEYKNDEVYSVSAMDYSGKIKDLEIERHEKGINKGDKVLIVDDWFETGGQGHAAIKLIEKAGGELAGISILLDDMNQEARNSFSKHQLNALVVMELFK